MRASEAKKIERNSPFERGVATTGRQDREPSTDVRNHLGILPKHSTTLPTWRQSGYPFTRSMNWSSQRGHRQPWLLHAWTAKRSPLPLPECRGGADIVGC